MRFLRANTPEERQRVVLALLEAWEAMPQLRLGQLIDSARMTNANAKPLLYIEDEVLVNAIKAYTKS